MSRSSREDWAKRVERWKDSGLSAKEFAAEVGVNASTLSYWKWRLGAGSKRIARKRSRRSTAIVTRKSPAKKSAALAVRPLSYASAWSEAWKGPKSRSTQ